jgi:hypothetical protein
MRMMNVKAVKYCVLAVLGLMAVNVSQAAKYGPTTIKGKFVFKVQGLISFAPFYDGTAGKTNSGIATAPRQDILRVGVMTSDGKGNLTGRTIATTDDGITTVVIDFNWTGSYTVSTNGDGTGTLTINAPTSEDINSCKSGDGTPLGGCASFEGAETYSFVISGNNHEKVLSLIETDNASGGAKIFLTGSIWTQNTQPGGGGSFSFPL